MSATSLECNGNHFLILLTIHRSFRFSSDSEQLWVGIYDRCHVRGKMHGISVYIISRLNIAFELNVESLFFAVLIRAQEMRMVHHPKCRKTLFVITVTEHLGVGTT